MAFESGVVMTNQDCKCRIIHHPEDREAADRLCHIINEACSHGCLIHECDDTQNEKVLSDLASINCVISLITCKQWPLHSEVYEMFLKFFKHHQFIPVFWNIEHSEIDNSSFGFLRREQRIMLLFDDDQFTSKLMSAIDSSVSVLSPAPVQHPLDSEVVNQGNLPSPVSFETQNGSSTCEPACVSTDTGSGVYIIPQADAVTKHLAIESASSHIAGDFVLSGENSHVKLDRILKNGQFIQVAIKTFKQPVTEKYKHLVSTLKRLRSPWLVPVFKTEDKPGFLFTFTTPYMTGGTLDIDLLLVKPDRMDKRAWIVTTACQISAGITFLHQRNIVHGDISPHHILFDHHGIARLVDCGMYTHKNAMACYRNPDAARVASAINSKICFMSDLCGLARVVLQLLKPSDFDTDSVNYALIEQFRRCFHSEKWPDDVITEKTIQVLWNCFQHKCDRTTSSKVMKDLREIMKLFRPQLLLPALVSKDDVCLYCSVRPVHNELKLRNTLCSHTCRYLFACKTCMRKFGSHCCVDNDVCECSTTSDYAEDKCPDHMCTIEPVIGGRRSFAMILYDASSDIADTCEDDAMNMVKLASHCRIMQMPFKNVHLIKVPTEAENIKQKCKCVEQAGRQILDGKPSYFLLYYSGHQLVQSNKSLPLSKYEELIRTLHCIINDIAETCPRMLMIFDCCCSYAVADLLSIDLSSEDHVEWHVVWMSSNREQESVINHKRQGSAFTELVVSALKGGTERPCPHGIEKCDTCLKFRQHCSNQGYVSLYDITKFVRKHLYSDQHSQRPMIKGTEVCEPVIAFFNKEQTLYTFLCEPTGDIFKTDDLRIDNIWDMTSRHLPKDAHNLEFFERYSMVPLGKGCVRAEPQISDSDSKRIQDAVGRDNKCLLVMISGSTQVLDSEDKTISDDGRSSSDDSDFSSSDSSVVFERDE